jgi:agmatine/peptidylarginine deiminase
MTLWRQRQARGRPADRLVPASEFAPRVPRRGLLVVVVFFALAVAALISLAVTRWSTAQWKQAEAELQRTRDAMQSAVDEREVLFAETERVVEDTLCEHGYLEKPLNIPAVDVLRQAVGFFTRYVEQHQTDGRAGLRRAEAYRHLGEINHWVGRIAESEAGYRESRRLLEQLCEEWPDPTARLLLAATNKSLGCFLATTGRAAEAERPASAAVAELDCLLAEGPDDCSVRGMLAEATRNLGLIFALLGRDGTAEVRRSVAESRRLASQRPDEIRLAEYLVDTLQILTQLLWRQGRLGEAEDACRESLREIDRLLETFQAFAERDGRLLPTIRYRKAMGMARLNLARLEGKSEADRPSADSWLWRPLCRAPGRILQAHLLLEGALPGEFQRQDALVMAWVDEPWCDPTMVKMVAQTHQHVQIIILVDDQLTEKDATQALEAAGVTPAAVRFCHVPTNSAWVRDYGPLVIDTGDGTRQCVAPYRQLDPLHLLPDDAHAPLALSRVLDMPVVPAPFFLDGGELLSNGEGLCLVSTRLLERNVQAGYAESHVTGTIRRLFGATQVVYLEPLHGEPTGHVDWFATFTAADTIVLGDYRGTDPVNAPLLDRHAERLAGVTTAKGPLKVVRIPMPPRGKQYFGGTYTNVVFANGVLLVPSYPEVPPDIEQEARDVFGRLLPGWKVVGIECSKHLTRHGGLHCAVANLFRAGPPSS